MENTEPALQVGQHVYWGRILKNQHSYNLYDLKVRSVYDTYFVAVDKHSKQSFLFNYGDIDKIVFINRADALEFLKDEELKNE